MDFHPMIILKLERRFDYVMTLEVRHCGSKHIVFDKFHKIMFDVRTLQGQTLNQTTCPRVEQVQLLTENETKFNSYLTPLRIPECVDQIISTG